MHACNRPIRLIWNSVNNRTLGASWRRTVVKAASNLSISFAVACVVWMQTALQFSLCTCVGTVHGPPFAVVSNQTRLIWQGPLLHALGRIWDVMLPSLPLQKCQTSTEVFLHYYLRLLSPVSILTRDIDIANQVNAMRWCEAKYAENAASVHNTCLDNHKIVR